MVEYYSQNFRQAEHEAGVQQKRMQAEAFYSKGIVFKGPVRSGYWDPRTLTDNRTG